MSVSSSFSSDSLSLPWSLCRRGGKASSSTSFSGGSTPGSSTGFSGGATSESSTGFYGGTTEISLRNAAVSMNNLVG